MFDGTDAPMTAVAAYLGLSRTELSSQMQAGKSLADIARAQGKTVAGLKAAMVTAMKDRLAAETTLSAAQRTAILAMMSSHLNAMVTGTHTSGTHTSGTHMSGTHMSGMDADDWDGSMMGGTGSSGMGGFGTQMMGR